MLFQRFLLRHTQTSTASVSNMRMVLPPCQTYFASLQDADSMSERQSFLSLVEDVQLKFEREQHADASCPSRYSRLQGLSNWPLYHLLQSLERDSLKRLYNSPSQKLKAATRLVMLERLAFKISEYRNDMFSNQVNRDKAQIYRKIILCGSIWNALDDPSRTESPQISSCRSSRQWPVLGRRTSLPDERKPSGYGDKTTLPNELLFQILEQQSSELLRSLLLPRPDQLGWVAATVLFERRRSFIKNSISREWSSNPRSDQCKRWGLIGEGGEEYLGRALRFMRRTEDEEKNASKSFWSEESATGQIVLGSWKLVCRPSE